MYHTFVIICAIFAVLMAVNAVVKAADIRRAVEEAEAGIRNLNHSFNQLKNDAHYYTVKIIASAEGVKAAVQSVKESADQSAVKLGEAVAALGSLERTSAENTERYIDFVRSLGEAGAGEASSPSPAPGQETLLVESESAALRQGEALADIVEPQNPAAV